MELHGSGAAARRALDEQAAAAFLTSLIHKVATPASGLSSVLHVACLPVLQVRKKIACITCHQRKHAGAVCFYVYARQHDPVLCHSTLCFGTACAQGSAPALQAACTALAQMVAASTDAKQQVMSMADHDLPPWPEVALFIRQVSWFCCDNAQQPFAEGQTGEACSLLAVLKKGHKCYTAS